MDHVNSGNSCGFCVFENIIANNSVIKVKLKILVGIKFTIFMVYLEVFESCP